MKKVSLKKSVTICFVSALIASSMGTMAFAVEPSDTVTDNSVVVSEQSEEQSVVSEVSKEESKVESVAESSVEDSGGKEESSKQESKVEEQSKVILPTGEQTVYFKVGFGGNIAKTSISNELGFFDMSSVRFSIYTKDKKIKLGSYTITDDNLETETFNNATTAYSVKVPEWVEGSEYIAVFESLPSIYPDSKQDCSIICTTLKDKDGNVVGYSGMKKESPLYFMLQPVNYNLMICVGDMKADLISSSVNLKVKGYDENEKVIYSTEVKSKDGFAFLKLTDSNIKSIGISSSDIVNNEVFAGEEVYDFDVYSADNYSPYKVLMQTNSTYEDLLKDDDGNETVKVSNVPVTLQYKDNNDMSIFKSKGIELGVYSGKELVQTLTLNKDNQSSNLILVKGAKYTVKYLGDTDYSVSFNSNTLTVNDNSKITVTAEPQLILKVIKIVNGESKPVNFKIESKEYKSDKEYKLSVNSGAGYIVTDLDTEETFDVLIGDYKETVLNLGTGDVSISGFVGNDDKDTSNGVSEDVNGNEKVPQTGDNILIIVLIIVGAIGIFSLGYFYFRKKGSKVNVKRK